MTSPVTAAVELALQLVVWAAVGMPSLSIACFRYRVDGLDDATLDALNTEIVQTLRAEGGPIQSTTRIEGKLAIRPCFVNAATTLAEVDALADRVVEIGDRLAARCEPQP